MLNVVCAWDESPVYTREYVENLRKAVARHLTAPYQFHCISAGWPGWWRKMEVFRAGRFDGPVLLLDLDTFIIKNIDFLAVPMKDKLLGLRDFSWPRLPYLSTAVLLFEPSYFTSLVYARLQHEDVWKQWKDHPGGDMAYLHDCITLANQRPDYMQEHFPARIISYKWDYLKDKDKLGPAHIVCCHGSPKPHEIFDENLRKHWTGEDL